MSRKRPDLLLCLVAGTLMTTTALGFVVRSSSTTLVLLLALAGLLSLATGESRRLAALCWREYREWVVALCALPLLIGLREAFSPLPQPRYIDAAARQALAIPVLLLAARLPLARLCLLRYSWLAALVLMLVAGLAFGDERIRTAFTNTIPYAAFALLFTTLLWISGQHGSARARALSAIGIACGAAIIVLSASRGVWLAILPALYFGWPGSDASARRRRRTAALIAVAVALTTFLVSPLVQERVVQAVLDLQAFQHGYRDFSALGLRLQMIFASWQMLIEHPWFGVGRDIHAAMADLHQRGVITGTAAIHADTHGELFHNAASLGIPGVLAWLLFYFGTLRPFWIARRSNDSEVSRAGRMGVACGAIFFVTGFTHITLGLAMYASIYAATQAILLAWLIQARRAAGGPH